jgi:ADP-dependent NAD(P)H-hydrate dehydratase / NAD(P)H-hydrate epimerase
LVLKGGPTFILHPDQPIVVNPTGDPGMATAGSGDVLTGLIAALLAQGLSTKDAAALGVFLHGLAGEHAAEDMTSYGMTASDIIYRFPEAFKFIII